MNDKMKYVARWLFVGHAANAAKHNLQQTFHRAASLPLFLSIPLPFFSHSSVYQSVNKLWEGASNVDGVAGARCQAIKTKN